MHCVYRKSHFSSSFKIKIVNILYFSSFCVCELPSCAKTRFKNPSYFYTTCKLLLGSKTEFFQRTYFYCPVFTYYSQFHSYVDSYSNQFNILSTDFVFRLNTDSLRYRWVVISQSDTGISFP